MQYYRIGLEFYETMDAYRQWTLPLTQCPACGNKRTNLASVYHETDLSVHAADINIKQLDGKKFIRHDWPRYEQLRNELCALLHISTNIPLGTSFGSLCGKVYAPLQDFCGPTWEIMVVLDTTLEILRSEGITNLKYVPTKLTPPRNKKNAFYELVLPAEAELSERYHYRQCQTCWVYNVVEGASVFKKGTLKEDVHLARCKQKPEAIVCTEVFKNAVLKHQMKGIRFTPIELSDE